MESNIFIQACMPAMADVVSGAVPRPRERAKGEAWEAWLVETPAYRKLELSIGNLGVTEDADLVDFLGDPDGALCVTDDESGRVICFNADGTRAAIRERDLS